MPQPIPNAPPDVAAALDRLAEDLAAAAGANLAGLILYGGLARGRYRAGRSDVNVVVLLHDASAGALAAIAPALQAAWRAHAVEPLILTPAEVAPAADAFPTKFLDIADYHIVLAGEDPFAALEVPREQVRQRVEQTLRNLLLRLRRRYVAAGDDPEALARALAGAARPLAIELAALLRLAGSEPETGHRTAAIFATAAKAFGLDRDALARLAALRQQPALPADLPDLYGATLDTLARAVDAASRMREAPR